MFKIAAFTALLAIVKASNFAAPLAAEWAAPLAVPLVKAAPVLKTTILEHQNNPQYAYSYGVQDSLTGDFKEQHETRNGDFVKGSYSLLEADGSKRIVDYHADSLNGFNAVVRKELPLAAPVLPVAKVVTKIAAPVLTQTPVVTKYAAAAILAPTPVVTKYAAAVVPQIKYAAPIPPPTPLVTKYAAPFFPSTPLVTKYAAPILPPTPLVAKFAAPIPPPTPLVTKYAAAFLPPTPLVSQYAGSLLPSAPLAAKSAALAPDASREPVRFSSPVARIETPMDYQLKMSRPVAKSAAPSQYQSPLAKLDLPVEARLAYPADLELEEINEWRNPALKQW